MCQEPDKSNDCEDVFACLAWPCRCFLIKNSAQKFCLPVKTSCIPVECVDETPVNGFNPKINFNTCIINNNFQLGW